MKQLACSVCGKKHQVSPEVNKVTSAECYITGEAPRVEDGFHYYSPDAFLKLVSVGFDDWKVIKDKTEQEKKREFSHQNSTKTGYILAKDKELGRLSNAQFRLETERYRKRA